MSKRTMVVDGKNAAMRKFCQDAYDVQDACNLTAIVGSLHQHLLTMRKECGLAGDELINHPATILFVNRIDSLIRCGSSERYSDAYQAVLSVKEGQAAEYDVWEL